MNSTTDFITELVRAANEVADLTSTERIHLLLRGFRMIRELRLRAGVRAIREKDKLRSLEIAALRAEHGTDGDAKTVLLETAEMIRTLKIILDAKNEALKDL